MLTDRGWLVAVILMASLCAAAVAADERPIPYWAYVIDPGSPPDPADTQPHRVPGSSVAFTSAQIRNLFEAPDWYPGTHPPMPTVVAHGRPPAIMACAYCHLPNGQGRPENARIAGLPAAYIIAQMADFKAGRRQTSDPRFLPAVLMAGAESAVAPGDVEEAARYFAAMKPRRWIRVVETATVPVTRAQAWMLVAVAGAGREPIGQRIIEMPDDLERTERRDDRSGFVAYVPPGSIARGERLASAAPACASCHGAGLRGTETVPGIAGRSPSYLVRQLYDIANGKRAGDGAALMQPVVARLTAVDVVAVAAFVASRRP